MASTLEVGHARNVANFQHLIAFIDSYGATYNPTKNGLKLSQLHALYTQANEALRAVNRENSSYVMAVNHRFEAFNDLRPLSTRVVKVLDTTEVPDEVVKEVKSTYGNVQGKRASKKEQPLPISEPVPRRISSNQECYDQVVEQFENLVSILESEPNYTPSEADLKTDALKSKLRDLKEKNERVTKPYKNMINARLNRYNVLYQKGTGLNDIALGVKKYVKFYYGATSPEFCLVSGIKFKEVN